MADHLYLAAIKPYMRAHLALVEGKDIHVMKPIAIDRIKYGNMDDWLAADKIENVRK